MHHTRTGEQIEDIDTFDPERKQSYEAFTFDTFRVKDGLLAEHWDSTPP